MSSPAKVGQKTRVVHDAIVLDDSNVPSWPTEDTDGVTKYSGDFQGAEICGIEWTVSGTFDLGTLDGMLEHSDDGAVWDPVEATNLKFAQLAANGHEWLPIPDGLAFKPFLRFALLAGNSGTTTNVKLLVHYNQIRAPGTLAYAGRVDRRE